MLWPLCLLVYPYPSSIFLLPIATLCVSMDAGGLAIGVVSLVLDLFEHGVKCKSVPFREISNV